MFELTWFPLCQGKKNFYLFKRYFYFIAIKTPRLVLCSSLKEPNVKRTNPTPWRCNRALRGPFKYHGHRTSSKILVADHCAYAYAINRSDARNFDIYDRFSFAQNRRIHRLWSFTFRRAFDVVFVKRITACTFSDGRLKMPRTTYTPRLCMCVSFMLQHVRWSIFSRTSHLWSVQKRS